MLWYLPLFHNVNQIHKYLSPIILFVFSLIIGYGITKLTQKNIVIIGTAFSLTLVYLLIILSLTNQFLTNKELIQNLFTEPKPDLIYSNDLFNNSFVFNA